MMIKKIRNYVLIVLLVVLTTVIGVEYLAIDYYSHNLSKLSNKELTLIFNKIIKQTRYTDKPIILYKVDSPEVNAWTLEDEKSIQVTITTGLLKFLHTKDQLAMVLGHECSHGVLRHLVLLSIPTPYSYNNQQTYEYYADLMGEQFAASAGYDVGEAGEIFLELGDVYGNAGGDHPDNYDRFEYLSRTHKDFKYYLHSLVYRNVITFNRYAIKHFKGMDYVNPSLLQKLQQQYKNPNTIR